MNNMKNKLFCGNIFKQESKCTMISLTILVFLGVSIMMNFLFNLPISMSRIGWLILTSVSLVLSYFGKREKKTLISNVIMYINVFVLCISLIVFKTILPFVKIVF
jgi:hypothetical protein